MTPSDDYRVLPLTQGMVALVSLEDYERVSQYKWCAKKCRMKWYACRGQFAGVKGKYHPIYMHRFVMGLELGDPRQVDHIDSAATLDNRRSNLRMSTQLQNVQNSTKKSNNTTGFKGVTLNPKDGRYDSRIRINGRKTYLGHFRTPEEAHKAYCEAAQKHFGEFARF